MVSDNDSFVSCVVVEVPGVFDSEVGDFGGSRFPEVGHKKR